MKKLVFASLLVLALVGAAFAFGGHGRGYGMGYGMGPGMGYGYGMGPGMGGPGMGYGYGMGPNMGYGYDYNMGPGMGYGYGMGPGMGYGFKQKFGQGKFWFGAFGNLTPEQQKEFWELRDAHWAKIYPLKQKAWSLRAELNAELNRSNPDSKRVEDLNNQLAKVQNEILKETLDFRKKLRESFGDTFPNGFYNGYPAIGY